MARRNIILGVLILAVVGGLWINAFRKLPSAPDKVVLKGGTEIAGEIISQDFGKYVLVRKKDNSTQLIIWDKIDDIHINYAPWYLRTSDILDSVLKLGVLGGFVVFGVGLWQYAQSQKWKRAEFLISEIRMFESKQSVASVRQMLEHEVSDIYLYGRGKGDDGEDLEPVRVDREMLLQALSVSEKPTNDQFAIQSALNVYLSHLDHFNNIVECGLVRKKELILYLTYWLAILGDPTNPKLTQDVREMLWSYIEKHGFLGARSLLKKFGHALRPRHSYKPKPTGIPSQKAEDK